jgi:tripartite-type tricarboxylate transporter receptor subunit TctC
MADARAGGEAMHIKKFHFVAALAAFSAASPVVLAQEFPARTVRLIVPFPPGGAVDILGRALATPMSKALGQNVIVENRPGANTVIGAELVARAPADGHTLLFMAPSFTINQFVRSKLPYDTVRDFTGVTLLASGALLIAVHPSVPARNTKELVQLARANPGQLTYATASIIGGQRLAGELFKDAAKIDIVNVPYNGGAPATMAVVGGHTTMLVTNIIEAAPQVTAGKLRGIAVTTLKRSEVLPQVPTVAESGYPGFDAGNWFGAVARTGTPRAVIDRLNAEIARGLELAEVREMLLKQGLTPAPVGVEEFNAFLRREMERTGRIVKMLNLKMD